MKDRDIYLQQVGLKQLGFDPGALDGDLGPKTRAARAAWEATLAPAAQPASLALRLIPVFAALVGIREVTKNQGPGIEQFWSATTYPTGYANREPYCAAAICWVVRKAMDGLVIPFSLPRSPVAYDFEKWALANENKGVRLLPAGTPPKPGDIFTLAAASHVGLIAEVHGRTVSTIEANTDGLGGREGDGVYRKTRNVSAIRKIIRITATIDI